VDIRSLSAGTVPKFGPKVYFAGGRNAGFSTEHDYPENGILSD
jgi:hypothetical protein